MERGNRLQNLRRTLEMDRGELAALCGVDERTVIAWEQGERRIPEGQLALLSDLFGVSTDHLLGHDEGTGESESNGDNGDDDNGDVAA